MKELTEKEKAKRYDEVLKVANKYKDTNIMFPSMQDEMFPELREPEDTDEKVRKALIKLVTNHASMDLFIEYDIHLDEALDWLEKKGEQNYKIIKGKNYFCVKTHNYAGIEWIKGRKYYASDNYTLVNQGCECYCPEYSKEEHNNLFEEVKCDGCVENQGEQKSAWSEKDEKMIGRIRGIVEKYAFSQSAVDVNGDLCEKEYIEADNWLKSLISQNH